MSFFETIVAHGDTIIVAIVAIILGWDKYKKGDSGLKEQINKEYKERNEQLEAKLKNCLDEIHKTNLTVANLQGTVTEKDKHIESLTTILQGRNPEMIEILKEIKDGNVEIQKFIKTTYELLSKSSEELDYQTKILEKSQQRNLKIDKASKAHVGAIVRIPNNGKSKNK